MEKLTLTYDNTDRFTDITGEVKIRYRDEVKIAGHRFKHLKNGLFAADPPFQADRKLLKKMKKEHADLGLVFELEDDNHMLYYHKFKKGTLVFAYDQHYNSNDCDVTNFLNLNGSEDEVIAPYLRENIRYEAIGNYYEDSSFESEDPDELLKPLYEPKTGKDGKKPWIRIGKDIAVMVEDGIYRFCVNHVDGEPPRVMMDYNRGFRNVHVAGIGHAYDFHPSFDGLFDYLAIGEEHFDRLKELCGDLGEGFFHEFPFVADEEPETQEPAVLKLRDLFDQAEKDHEEAIQAFRLPNGAIPLVEGLGFQNLTIGYSMSVLKKVKPKSYDFAYILGNELVLVGTNGKELQEEHHRLALMDKLYVSETRHLACGLDYPYLHRVIDKKDKLRELLCEEAWEEYQKENATD